MLADGTTCDVGSISSGASAANVAFHKAIDAPHTWQLANKQFWTVYWSYTGKAFIPTHTCSATDGCTDVTYVGGEIMFGCVKVVLMGTKFVYLIKSLHLQQVSTVMAGPVNCSIGSSLKYNFRACGVTFSHLYIWWHHLLYCANDQMMRSHAIDLQWPWRLDITYGENVCLVEDNSS